MAQRTPTQHGSAELGFRLEDREVMIGFAWPCGGTLEARRRKGAYKALGYLSSPLTLRRATRDRRVFELRQCFGGGGLELDSDQAYDDYEFSSARLVCRDPCWYGASHSYSAAYAAFTHGVYSDTLTVTAASGSLTTEGDWYSFPTLAITGPCSYFDLQSTTTGQRLRYYGAIAAAEVVTIVCNPHPAYLSATSTLAAGSVEEHIYPEDDFGGFCLWPDPLAAGGANEWTFEVMDTAAGFQVAVTWEDRWQGA
jgi:hypothetical protein